MQREDRPRRFQIQIEGYPGLEDLIGGRWVATTLPFDPTCGYRGVSDGGSFPEALSDFLVLPAPGGRPHFSAQDPFLPSSPKLACHPSLGPQPGKVLALPGLMRFNRAAQMMQDDVSQGP